MHRFVFGCLFILPFLLTGGLCPPLALAADWSQFRGPNGDGHADTAKLPTEWDKTENVTWRKEVAGLGWSSPVVAGGTIYLTTAVPGANQGDYSLRALCLDAKTGKVLWDKEVFKEDGTKAPAIHKKNSHASPTPLVDGDHVFVHFGHMGTACLNAKDGSRVWAQQTLGYNPVHGNGGSPVLAADRLIFCIDGTDKQQVVALDRKTGKVAWQTPRNTRAFKPFSFCTPLLITVNGQEQLIAPGSEVVMSLDPKSGKEIWRVIYEGYSVVPKPVYGNGLVYLSTGYDTPQVYAIKPDGKGDVTNTHVAWTVKKAVPRNASPLLVDDALYMADDNGQLTCLDAKTGKERWNERVGRAFSASPLYANGLIYLLDEDGIATVVKPGASFEMVAKNRMGERALASYGVDGDALLLRTEKALYRIEKK
jgi:outer membrane protein assembly factor BamB